MGGIHRRVDVCQVRSFARRCSWLARPVGPCHCDPPLWMVVLYRMFVGYKEISGSRQVNAMVGTEFQRRPIGIALRTRHAVNVARLAMHDRRWRQLCTWPAAMPSSIHTHLSSVRNGTCVRFPFFAYKTQRDGDGQSQRETDLRCREEELPGRSAHRGGATRIALPPLHIFFSFGRSKAERQGRRSG